MGRRIDQLDPATDLEVANPASLWILGDPSTGELKKVTRAQLASVVSGVGKETYVATGSEGDTLTIPAIAGKFILSIAREGMIIYEVESAPESAEFTWDDTDIVLGTPVSYPGERFLILYV